MDTVLQTMEEMKSYFMNSSKEVKEEIKTLSSEISSINITMDQVKSHTGSIKSSIIDLNNKIGEIETKNKNLELQCNRLTYELDGYRRSKNIIIYNIDENLHDGSLDSLEEIILKLFTEQMKIKFSVNEIDFIKPLGRRESKSRPILVRFCRSLMKNKVLRSAYLLKGSKISISQDFSREVRERRKLLYPFLLKARSENVPSKLVNDKLIIAGQSFSIADIESTELKESVGGTQKEKVINEETDTADSEVSNKEGVNQIKKKRKRSIKKSSSQATIKNWIFGSSNKPPILKTVNK